ncbi:MAG: hypothetical protein EBR82_12515 [Caulobacteraceae bacterium]|nr:hypothetical protein [Caulobacteraceae bacterium]
MLYGSEVIHKLKIRFYSFILIGAKDGIFINLQQNIILIQGKFLLHIFVKTVVIMKLKLFMVKM